MSQKKYITISAASPNCGPTLEKAMVIEDKVTQRFYECDDSPVKSLGLMVIEEQQEATTTVMPQASVHDQPIRPSDVRSPTG
jgi:hypothetical protein